MSPITFQNVAPIWTLHIFMTRAKLAERQIWLALFAIPLKKIIFYIETLPEKRQFMKSWLPAKQ